MALKRSINVQIGIISSWEEFQVRSKPEDRRLRVEAAMTGYEIAIGYSD